MLSAVYLLLFLQWNIIKVTSDMASGDGGSGSEKCVQMISDDEDISNCSVDGQDFSGSGSNEDNVPCCSRGIYDFYSFGDVVNNITSNTIIIISTDVLLFSNVTLEGVYNITIIGQGNPTVKCNDMGSVKFVSCNNVTIEGINWEKCGSVDNPGMEIYNASNIAIQRCSFHRSTGKAVALSKVSGNVSINHCKFTHNKYHNGHGVAIYYTSSHEQSTHLIINNCDFTLNGPAESVVHVDNSNSKINIFTLQSSTFIQNRGVPVNISHTSLIVIDTISFKDNKATVGGAIYSSNSIIKFDDKCNVIFSSNSANIGGAIYQTHSMMLFGENAEAVFKSNTATKGGGGAIFQTHSKLLITMNTALEFTRNTAGKSSTSGGFGGAVRSETNSLISFEDQSVVIFKNNRAGHGAALYSGFSSDIIFRGNSTLSFTTNNADYGGAVRLLSSVVKFGEHTTVYFTANSARINGGAFYTQESSIKFHGHATVIFTRNNAGMHAGAIDMSLIRKNIFNLSFGENSKVTFIENRATYRCGAVQLVFQSSVIFQGHSTVSFIKNRAVEGGAIRTLFSTSSPAISFTNNSTVIFSSNNVISEGGAVLIDIALTLPSPKATFTGSSKVTFSNNNARRGGALYCNGGPYEIIFQRNTNVTFKNNRAIHGGAVYFSTNSYITFTGSADVNFFNNTASLSGGAISSLSNSGIWFKGSSTVYFNRNLARQHGGAISSVINTRIAFIETCSVMFESNTAIQQGGAVYLFDKSAITFEDSCNVSYDNNTALQQGGAVYFALQSNVSFKGHSNIAFKTNNAIISGGAMYTFSNNPVYFEENCTILFDNNMVRKDGGAIYFVNTSLYFSGRSSVTFIRNIALQQGGALNFFDNCAVMFQDESNVIFTHNTAMQHGGAVYVHDNGRINFSGSNKVSFQHNTAESDGGALYSYDHCNITIGNNSEVMFVSNSAMQCGGAMYCVRYSDITLKGQVTFAKNTAEHGGAVCVSQSTVKFSNNSVMTLSKNRALENGGGLYFTNNFQVSFDHGSSIKFIHNTANRYGGAFYSEVNHEGLSKLTLNTTKISFTGNSAFSGNSVYLDIPTSCDEACLKRSIVGIDQDTFKHGPLVKHIHTPPSKLVLYHPAVCVDNDNITVCGTYFVNNIMLGQEIIINACVLGYYDQPAGETRFTVDSHNQDHYINGSSGVLISCAALQGINVTGSKISDATNFTLNITSHAGTRSNFRTISIELITELSPCHPGFYYSKEKCACYHDDDIITCSGSASFIKRGYWFGEIKNKSTVAVCPNNYCNFTCCEVTNGFYQLSPMRMNQCSSHRSGIACGSCEEGYTLSFDSVECVSVDKCTTGQTVLVVTLSMAYWIVIVILVFIMTYYHVGIGYLYAITYYYSILDILLSHSLYQSRGLLTAVSIISSVVKVTPQFLGQLCLVEDISGIDQQFIHYTHPLAVSVIIMVICQAARISYKFSSFISRGIIRTVCFLLLLSYTSVATTSLLLLRSLTFDNVDKVYTYLSPDLEYFHGRHLPYFIVAVLCTLVIVIGLPLLLLLEPFLNHKISFTRMKPLLDQFQGCFKDKYRCFAAYYMICRLVVIIIIILIPFGSDLSQFLLISSSVVLTVFIIIVKPYKHHILNLFDGLILLLVVLAALIPLADNVSHKLSTATIITVMTLPLIFFIALELIVHRETIKTVSTKMTAKFKTKPVPTSNNNNEVPMSDIGLVIDDNMRKNATICEIPSNTRDDATHYRESLMEVIDQIED